MTTRIGANATRAAKAIRRTVAEEIRRLREDAGISQRRLASAAGIAQSVISRIEADHEHPSVETYAAIATALGADLSLRLYPNSGPAIRDRHQAPIIDALIRLLHPRWKPFPEVGVRSPVRGWIDLVLVDPGNSRAVASEFESTTHRLEQVLRWSGAKADALPSSRSWPFGVTSPEPMIDKLLILRDTGQNRSIAKQFEATLRAAYPADPWQALAALRGESHWPGSTLLWAARFHGGYEIRPAMSATIGRLASAYPSASR
jgi:transcriptional regulator with XRE-family HTH domain